MFSESKLDRYSEVLIWAIKTARKGAFRKNDIFLIRYQLGALKLAEALHAKLLDMGMNPVLRLGLTSDMERNFYEKANQRQLVFHAPGEKTFYENLNGGIYLIAPDSLTHLKEVDPVKIGKTAIAMKPYRDILNKREEKGLFGWTLGLFPTPELAKKAGLTLKQYASQVIRACYLDKVNPIQAWKSIYKDAMSIKQWLNNIIPRSGWDMHVQCRDSCSWFVLW